jgi:hypothetical protein
MIFFLYFLLPFLYTNICRQVLHPTAAVPAINALKIIIVFSPDSCREGEIYHTLLETCGEQALKNP